MCNEIINDKTLKTLSPQKSKIGMKPLKIKISQEFKYKHKDTYSFLFFIEKCTSKEFLESKKLIAWLLKQM